MSEPERPVRVGLVAGEASGDALGAKLIETWRAQDPRAVFFGVAGPKMRAAGCEAWERAESLAVMGLVAVVPHLPRLLRLAAHLEQRFLAERPDVFVGIDAKEFNLRLARKLRAGGLPTVQYVSPQIWAWRQGRIKHIHRAVDLVLCLLPFEKRFYDERGLAAEFVGHPLADAIPLVVDRAAARRELGLAVDATVVALLPGSRRAEVAALAADFAATVRYLDGARPGLRILAPMANAAARDTFHAVLEREGLAERVQLLDGAAQTALIACDVALIASGTATLEAALCKRPMVVVYRTDRLTAWLVRRFKLVKAAFFAQPNLLAGRRIVGEYFQEDIDPERIGAELLAWIDDPARRAQLVEAFDAIHRELRRGASERAVAAIRALLAARAGA